MDWAVVNRQKGKNSNIEQEPRRDPPPPSPPPYLGPPSLRHLSLWAHSTSPVHWKSMPGWVEMQSAAVVVSIRVISHSESLNWISPFCCVASSHTKIWPAPWSSTHVLNGSGRGAAGSGEERRGGKGRGTRALAAQLRERKGPKRREGGYHAKIPFLSRLSGDKLVCTTRRNIKIIKSLPPHPAVSRLRKGAPAHLPVKKYVDYYRYTNHFVDDEVLRQRRVQPATQDRDGGEAC